jgi:hypothetical protein
MVRWDGFSIHVDLDMLELLAGREIRARVPEIEEIHVTGADEEITVHGVARWHGIPLGFAVRLAELRVRRRFFGCRLEAVKGPLGAGVPAWLLRRLAARFGHRMVTFDPADRILLFDLRRFIPTGIEVRIARVVCLGRWLEISLAPGALATSSSGSLGTREA